LAERIANLDINKSQRSSIHHPTSPVSTALPGLSTQVEAPLINRHELGSRSVRWADEYSMMDVDTTPAPNHSEPSNNPEHYTVSVLHSFYTPSSRPSGIRYTRLPPAVPGFLFAAQDPPHSLNTINVNP